MRLWESERERGVERKLFTKDLCYPRSAIGPASQLKNMTDRRITWRSIVLL